MDLAKLLTLPVLSIRQPWASYILAGIKTLELRSWSTEYRGWLWIHAGRQLDFPALEALGLSSQDFWTGGLLGIAELASCALIKNSAQWQALRNEHRSPSGFSGEIYAWRFIDTLALNKTVECRGALGLYWLDLATKELVQHTLQVFPANRDFLETAIDLKDLPIY